MHLNIVGLKKHWYWGKIVTQDDHSIFKTTDKKLVKYIICLKDKLNKCYELELWNVYDQCSSGYTTAKWGKHRLTLVDHFGAITHVPKRKFNTSIIYKDEYKEEDGDEHENIYYKCEWFGYSYNGGDGWYPCGRIWVVEEKFNSTGRGYHTNPVWIFRGKSHLGKSFLARQISNMVVYETDRSRRLPKKIIADIVVVGNKYNHSLDTIKQKIDGKIICVEFCEQDQE